MLWSAVERNDVETVEQLLENGTDVEEKFQGWTPLMIASQDGFVDIMRMLINKRADLEAANKNGRTALSFAAAPSMRGGWVRRDTPLEALRLLLTCRADPKRECDFRGKTAAQYAGDFKRHDALQVFKEHSTETLRLLLSPEAKPSGYM